MQAWTTWFPPAASEPVFQIDGEGGPDARPGLAIEATGAVNACGCWRQSLRFESGRHYRVEVAFRTEGVPSPEKSVRAILNDDSNGRFHDQLNPGPGRDCWAILSRDLDGGAVRGALTLNLFLAYTNRGRVVWAEARCCEIDPPVPRKVRVAAVNKPAQTMVVSPRGEILDRADTSPGSIARAECDLDQTVRDFSGRPLSCRYDVLRRSDTFGGLGDSIFERR